MTTPSNDESSPSPSSGSPTKVTPEEGYQPVRQEFGAPVTPQTEVPAPQPMTLQPPRRVAPEPVPTPEPTTTSEPAAPAGTTSDASTTPPAGAATTPATSASSSSARDTPDSSTPGPAATNPDTARPDASQAPVDALTPATEEAENTGTPTAANPFARPAEGEPEPVRKPEVSAARRLQAGELVDQLNAPEPRRAHSGWRALLGLAPSKKEASESTDLEAVRKDFERPITIMIANPKGGAGKTPLSLLLAGTFGAARGGGVVAWDNNELRGTMPHRSVSDHRRNVRDLLNEASRLADAGFTDVAHFLNHQKAGTFHTLGSAQGSGQAITHQDFEVVHRILSRFFEIIVVDTGNNEAAPNWAAAAEHADFLVVPMKWRKDSLIPAARMIESLQESHPELLERTLIVATNGPSEAQNASRKTASEWFGSRYRVMEIPTDTHIAAGDIIVHDRVDKATRRAALAIAATIAGELD